MICKEMIDAVNAHRPVLLVGPPGTYKTMIARRLALLMEPPTGRQREEWLKRLREAGIWAPWAGQQVPEVALRAPHHTVSLAGMVGQVCRGCGRARHGELALAHGGLLFLDEVEEFTRPVIDAVDMTMRRGVLDRAVATRGTPASFALVCTSNDERRMRRKISDDLYTRSLVVQVPDAETGERLVRVLDAMIEEKEKVTP